MSDSVSERMRGVIDRFRAKPEEAFVLTEAMRTEPDGVDNVMEVLNGKTTDGPKRYTPEQAAEAILWRVENLVRATAATRGLDRAEVHRQVFRRLTLASLRLRDYPNELLKDIEDVAAEYRMHQGSGCD